MLPDLKKLFSKETTLGRLEYLKTVFGLLLFPMLLINLAIIIPPDNLLSYPLIVISIITFLLYSIIVWIATYKRITNIFNNTIISILLLILFIFSGIVKILNIIFNILLLLIPGNKKSDNITPDKLCWITFTLVIILFIVGKYSGFSSFVATESMADTLKTNDRLIINIFDKNYKRGDIIFHKFGKSVYVKRIIGLPGEKVEIKTLDNKTHHIYINGELLEEPYVKNVCDYPKISSMPYSSATVPDDSYYVIGDNRGNSFDSRYYGAINKNLIKGKLSHIWFPINRRRVFRTPEYSFSDNKK